MIVVVLHEPQELVNVAHVVRAMKNFAVATELRLVAPREFDLWRIEGIAHRSADVLARTAPFETLDAALADCVHVAGFTARERTAKHTVRRPRDAAPALLVELAVVGRIRVHVTLVAAHGERADLRHLAAAILDAWPDMVGRFVKVIPIDYRKALAKMRAAEHRDTETTPATEEVFYG